MGDKNRRYYRDRRHGGSRTRFLMTFDLTKLIIIGVVLIVLIGGIIFGVSAYNAAKKPKGPGPQEVDAVTTLNQVVKNSSLSTYEVVYNGVATVYNENKPEEVDYYVAYTATVNAGLDFKKIEISKDDDKHEIVVSLPSIELYEPKVKIEELDYIVVGKKVKTETISADAYKICIDDVDNRARHQAEIYKYAMENGERLIRGLITPFIDNLDEEYTIKFVWRDIK